VLAKTLVTEAHGEAKEALVELRNLARGIHPAVLTDRGLDAAVSALAARCPIPVAVDVDLPRRVSPASEAIAYFVVAEALTNVAKHAQATRAWLTVELLGDSLVVEVLDNGRGGAIPTGIGISGLRDRVRAVDGELHLSSPPGGGTTLRVELPCER
jgi:signal transduction histidine kinase